MEPITVLLRRVTKVEFGVLAAAGISLFFLPDVAQRIWPWPLSPFNARFLGAIYLASLAGVVSLLWVGRRDPAILVVPLILTFTVVVLAVSVLYVDRFAPFTLITAAWFFLYAALPLNAAWYLWRARTPGREGTTRLAAAWRALLVGQGVVSGGYGLGLLVAPGAVAGFWPWHVDDFHGRMYSAALLALGLASLICVWRWSPIKLVTLGVIELALGGFAALGLAVVDSSAHRVDWTSAGTLTWLAACLIAVVAGLAMIVRWRRSPASPRPERNNLSSAEAAPEVQSQSEQRHVRVLQHVSAPCQSSRFRHEHGVIAGAVSRTA